MGDTIYDIISNMHDVKSCFNKLRLLSLWSVTKRQQRVKVDYSLHRYSVAWNFLDVK